MKLSTVGVSQEAPEGEDKRCLDSELWHACAGPLVCLPTSGTRVVYFPQGHSEQVVASTNKEVEGHIPNYPNLLPQLLCQLHSVTLHAELETDEVYAQMTLQPLSPEEQKDTCFPIEMSIVSKQPTNYFCKTLTASDTSTHGGFSVPRRAAEKVFPPLDFTQQPPAQELIAHDLHDVEWKFRHIFRGQPKRHLLTTGWSVFVSAKRLVAGDSVLFIWNEKNQLLLGIRRASRPQASAPSSVLSSDSMHIGLLAAAAHAAATNSRFTIFYNPRASPSEFIIPLSKYIKAVFHTRISIGMRFRMLFETEESNVRRYMGTITGISDLDPVRWPNSHWRTIQVGWDESAICERQHRVSLWEIEPLVTFPMYPSLFPISLKRSLHPGGSFLHENKEDDELNALMWSRGVAAERGLYSLNRSSLGTGPWIQQRMEPLLLGSEFTQYQGMSPAAFQDKRCGDIPKKQYLQNQQPIQFIQQSGSSSSLLQHHDYEQTQQPIVNSQPQCLNENQRPSVSYLQLQPPQNEQHMQQAEVARGYTQAFPMHINPMQQQPELPCTLFEGSVISDSTLNFSPVPTSSSVQGILGSAYHEGAGSSNYSQLGESMPYHQSWEPKISKSQVISFDSAVLLPSFPAKDGILGNENFSDNQNYTLFGGIKDPSLLNNPATSLGTINDVSNVPCTSTCFQNSSYGYLDVASDALQNARNSDPQPQNFVKVYKSGSVGRSLDISRFSNYSELRKELGQMFGTEGLFEDPLRSGWQLVFVDRENDVLLLGDDPWESFVNNVWYIKILSPDDVLKMGKQGVESFRVNSS